jgi:hypothetical protein
MTFSVEYDFPALHTFMRIPWPLSQDVDAAVFRFTREHAPSLPSGVYRIRAAGYAMGLCVDARRGTVLVLYLYRRR